MSGDPNNTKWSRDQNKIGNKLLKSQGWDGTGGLGKHGTGSAEIVKVSKKDNVLGIGYDSSVAPQQSWSTQSVGFASVLERLRDKNKGNGAAKKKSKKHVAGEDGGEESHGEEEDDDVSPVFRRGAARRKSGDENDDDEDDEQPHQRKSATAGKHAVAYAKRRQLKTGALFDSDAKDEVLGAASTSSRKHGRSSGNGQDEDEEDDEEENDQSHRKSGSIKNKRLDRSNDDDDDEKKKKKKKEAVSTLVSPLLQRLFARCGEHEYKPSLEAKSGAEDGTVIVSNFVSITKPDPRPPTATATPFYS